jgi:hypothetical protein
LPTNLAFLARAHGYGRIALLAAPTPLDTKSLQGPENQAFALDLLYWLSRAGYAVDDRDGDGLLDATEDRNDNGAVDGDETNWLDPDSDGDGVPDGLEDTNRNGEVDKGETDPRRPDTDGDRTVRTEHRWVELLQKTRGWTNPAPQGISVWGSLLLFEDGAGHGLGKAASAAFTRLFEVLDLFDALHQTLFVALLFETTERFFKRLVGLYANFSHEYSTSPRSGFRPGLAAGERCLFRLDLLSQGPSVYQ